MAKFNDAYAITMAHEGGYANNKADSGGETWKGVARNKHPNWAGWIIVDQHKSQSGFPANLKDSPQLQEQVLLFYKKEFWDRLRLDEVDDQRIANEIFDTAVNMGTGIAAIFVQRVLNVSNRNGKDYADLSVDGVIGPKTVSVINNHPRRDQVLKLLNVLQGERYINICEANRTQEIFLTSWSNRVFEYYK